MSIRRMKQSGICSNSFRDILSPSTLHHGASPPAEARGRGQSSSYQKVTEGLLTNHSCSWQIVLPHADQEGATLTDGITDYPDDIGEKPRPPGGRELAKASCPSKKLKFT